MRRSVVYFSVAEIILTFDPESKRNQGMILELGEEKTWIDKAEIYSLIDDLHNVVEIIERMGGK